MIASTMYDAYSTADVLLADYLSPTTTIAPGLGLRDPPLPGVPLEIEGVNVVSYSDWKRIEEAERVNGVRLGRPGPVKIVGVDQMLEAVGK